MAGSEPAAEVQIEALEAPSRGGCGASVRGSRLEPGGRSHWRLMLGEGSGFGVCDASGRWIASALVLPLGPAISWIGVCL